jgi:hypothetical protein
MGFEPTTPTLARLCSTPELRPHDAPAAWGPRYIGKPTRLRNTDVAPAALPAGPGPLDRAAPLSHFTRIRVRAFSLEYGPAWVCYRG